VGGRWGGDGGRRGRNEGAGYSVRNTLLTWAGYMGMGHTMGTILLTIEGGKKKVDEQ
jgi:hypothetical protein